MQYHSLVDFQRGVKIDSISLPDICTESSECHTDTHVHCSGENASQVGEFINNFQFLSIHSDCWFIFLVGARLLSFCAD